MYSAHLNGEVLVDVQRKGLTHKGHLGIIFNITEWTLSIGLRALDFHKCHMARTLKGDQGRH